MAGSGAVANALANPGQTSPEMGLVGPTVDDDVRRAISRYGRDAVKDAVRRQTAARKGRPKLPDWKELQPVIEAEARCWLEGGDPFSERTNYSIAKEFADANPGQSHPATMKRLLRKLGSRKYGREWYVLVTAWSQIEKEGYSYTSLVRTLEALVENDHDPRMWKWHLEQARAKIADYSQFNGEAPPDHLTMKEVEEGARPANALLGLGKPTLPRSIFGSLVRPSNG